MTGATGNGGENIELKKSDDESVIMKALSV